MPVNFSWIAGGLVAGMARPYPEDAAWLRREGVTAILSLTMRPPEGVGGFRLFHVPVIDMSPPSLDDLERAVGFLEEVIGAGGRPAVHCGAGIGRTGTVLAAFLVARGAGAEEAILRVRTERPGSIETEEQEAAIREFALFLRSRQPERESP